MTDKSQSIENLVNMAVGGHLEFVQKSNNFDVGNDLRGPT